jgi:hypothetical protein
MARNVIARNVMARNDSTAAGDKEEPISADSEMPPGMSSYGTMPSISADLRLYCFRVARHPAGITKDLVDTYRY